MRSAALQDSILKLRDRHFCFYILVQILLLRKKFRPIDLTQLVFSTIFGRFVDVAKKVVGDFAIPTYPGQLVMLAISIVFCSNRRMPVYGCAAGKHAHGRNDSCSKNRVFFLASLFMILRSSWIV